MTSNILAPNNQISNPDSVYFIVDEATDLAGLLDGIYPYDHPQDQWVVVIDCQPIAWARDWSVAAMQEIETLRIRREHAASNPDEVPFDGMVFASGIEWDDDYGLAEVTL